MDERTVDAHPLAVGIRFRPTGRIYDFDPGPLILQRDDRVLVETERGPALGLVVVPPRPRATVRSLQRVIKKADARDLAREDQNLQRERSQYRVALELIRGRGLAIKLVKAESAFDGSKVTFFSVAEDRVDFRGIVSELGELLHTRVEMKSIGARDETKSTGGVGPCGRELCCSSWLQEFQAVSVKMAKEQGLSLNPSKLAGMCGRLKCCLRYEFQTYVELKRTLPAVGAKVESVKGDGVVVRQNILKQTVVVRRAEDNVEVETNLDDLVAPRADA
ncbi:MAG TPA: regulatory iron-sulfur-containing complex subunit RicT [Candidatus Binatus sp.]|jgi:cell fate regulator YaaT (PSP1 superfamily)|nr:regulatory iron-sulfur-containing complex subunit RicT [Candidatus Binatus sp.]